MGPELVQLLRFGGEGAAALVGFVVVIRAYRESNKVKQSTIEELRYELNRLAHYRDEALGGDGEQE